MLSRLCAFFILFFTILTSSQISSFAQNTDQDTLFPGQGTARQAIKEMQEEALQSQQDLLDSDTDTNQSVQSITQTQNSIDPNSTQVQTEQTTRTQALPTSPGPESQNIQRCTEGKQTLLTQLSDFSVRYRELSTLLNSFETYARTYTNQDNAAEIDALFTLYLENREQLDVISSDTLTNLNLLVIQACEADLEIFQDTLVKTQVSFANYQNNEQTVIDSLIDTYNLTR